MAQVAAARSIHGSFFNQGSGSVLERVDKLKPASFASKVLARDEEKSKRVVVRRNSQISAKRAVRVEPEVIPVSPEDVLKREEQYEQLRGDTSVGMWSRPIVRRKTKIVCTIGPSTNTREMIWKLAETGMNVARLKMSHGDHASHQKVIDLVKDYNAQFKDNTIAIMLDTKGPEVRSGNLSQPITLTTGQEFTFTIQRGVGAPDCVSANYDNFVNDVEVGDMLLVDALPPPCNQEPACMCNVISNFSSSMMPLMVKSKTEDSVKCEVVDGGELKSRRHLNFQGKSARLLSIT